jgi:hypothetical protein
MEKIRRFMRARLGYRSRLYRLASRAATTVATIRQEGFRTWLQLSRIARMESGEAVSMRFRSVAHPILIRSAAEDLAAVFNNIIRHEYGQFPPREYPVVLVDGGA